MTAAWRSVCSVGVRVPARRAMAFESPDTGSRADIDGDTHALGACEPLNSVAGSEGAELCSAHLFLILPQGSRGGGALGHVSDELDAVEGNPPGVDQHRLLHKPLHRPQPPETLCAAVQVQVNLRHRSSRCLAQLWQEGRAACWNSTGKFLPWWTWCQGCFSSNDSTESYH